MSLSIFYFMALLYISNKSNITMLLNFYKIFNCKTKHSKKKIYKKHKQSGKFESDLNFLLQELLDFSEKKKRVLKKDLKDSAPIILQTRKIQ